MNNELLKGKFSNIFIKLLVGIMSNDLKDVKHFLSDDLINRFQKMINDNLKNNELRCFDELNVKDIVIEKTSQDETYDYVYVSITSRYMDYYIDSNTSKYKRGIDDHRIEINHQLIFRKKREISTNNIAIRCSNCGANLDSNNSGYCKYCGKTNSAEDYDYILCEITNL